MKIISIPVVIEKTEDGYYAYSPQIQGAYTQADTYELVLENIKEVIELCLEDEKEKSSYEISVKAPIISLTQVMVSF